VQRRRVGRCWFFVGQFFGDDIAAVILDRLEDRDRDCDLDRVPTATPRSMRSGAEGAGTR
jgi:hypothetical protein